MLFFGPCTVKHNSVDIGKTVGGISISLDTAPRNLIGKYNLNEVILGGTGNIDFYEWTGSITLSDSTDLLGFNDVIFDGSPRYKITIYECKMLIDTSNIKIGVNIQNPFKVKFVFRPDTSGNVIKFE